MASVSISHAIMFVASLVVAAAVAGVLVTGVEQVGDSLADRSADVSDTIAADVTIISDPGAPDSIYRNGTGEDELVLLVKNTGSESLAADERQLDILIRGQLVVDGVTVERVDDATDQSWPQSSVVRVTIANASERGFVNEAGDNRVVVEVNGNRDTIEFRLGDDE